MTNHGYYRRLRPWLLPESRITYCVSEVVAGSSGQHDLFGLGPTMRSDIYTATAMSNKADAALQEAVQKLWQAAVSQPPGPIRRQLPNACGEAGHQ